MNKPYSNALVALLKGIVYNHHDKLWSELLAHEADIKRYFADIFLDLIIDKSEGYAYLKQTTPEDESFEYPRLIEKRQLNFYTSLLCLLLRRNLVENDSEGESTKAIVSKEDIVEMMRPFAKETSNEALQLKQIEAAIKKVRDEGFLRKMKTEDEQYEINRIIKAFVNADAVKDGLEKLRAFAGQAGSDEEPE